MTTPKQLTYGDGNAVIILAAARMGLKPLNVDNAKRQLEGEAIHPTVGAAIDNEAIRVNDGCRQDHAFIAKANIHFQHIAAEYGFSHDLTKDAFLALQDEAETLGTAHAMGQDLPEHAPRLQVIARLMEASQWTLDPDNGCVLKLDVENDRGAMAQRG